MTVCTEVTCAIPLAHDGWFAWVPLEALCWRECLFSRVTIFGLNILKKPRCLWHSNVLSMKIRSHSNQTCELYFSDKFFQSAMNVVSAISYFSQIPLYFFIFTCNWVPLHVLSVLILWSCLCFYFPSFCTVYTLKTVKIIPQPYSSLCCPLCCFDSFQSAFCPLAV